MFMYDAAIAAAIVSNRSTTKTMSGLIWSNIFDSSFIARPVDFAMIFGESPSSKNEFFNNFKLSFSIILSRVHIYL